jgi:hypothetical protein
MKPILDKEKKMKNKKLLLAILAIALVFGMTACKEDGGGDNNGSGGSGGLTITGLDAFDGKYVFAYSDINIINEDEILILIAAESVDPVAAKIKAVKISDGKATLPVWRQTSLITAVKYTGSDTVDFIDIYIYNKADVTVGVTDYLDWGSAKDVKFTNGSATATFYSDD